MVHPLRISNESPFLREGGRTRIKCGHPGSRVVSHQPGLGSLWHPRWL